MTTDKECTRCCMGFWAICLTVSFIWFLSVIAGFSTTDNYEDEYCNITKVLYPTLVPNSPNSSNDLWTDCDCGKRCNSKTPCNKIIVDIPNGPEVMILRHTIKEHSDGTECTFRDNHCSNEWDTYGRMEYAKTMMNEYVLKMNSHTKIKCWLNEEKNEAYLDNEVDMTQIIISSSLVGGFIIILLITWCISRNRDKNINEKNSKSKVSPFVEETV